MTRRRFYLLKRQAARARWDDGLAMTWRSKQEREAGTPLPAEVRTDALAEAGYTCREDLEGATLHELVSADVPYADATAALAYVAAFCSTPT